MLDELQKMMKDKPGRENRAKEAQAERTKAPKMARSSGSLRRSLTAPRLK
jgi:hypothetical protein